MEARLIKFTDGDVKTESFLKDFMFGKIFAGFTWKEIEKDFSPEEDNLKIAREIYDQERATWVSLTTGVDLNKVFGKSFMKKKQGENEISPLEKKWFFRLKALI